MPASARRVFSETALVANIRAFADAVMKAKPSGAKGTFLKRVAVTSTMGPGVKIEPASLTGGAVTLEKSFGAEKFSPEGSLR